MALTQVLTVVTGGGVLGAVGVIVVVAVGPSSGRSGNGRGHCAGIRCS